MSALALVNTVAGNAILGSVSTKLFDSLISSRFTQKHDKNKWLREKTLNLFSELSHNITEINCENLKEKQKLVNELTSKINLLIDDKKLKTNLKNYSFILNEYECYKSEINLEHINEELINTLRLHVKKM
ncbi:hypothetical protein [Poseidonibacter antarcticus]|uniref:hypothetical protein n=1 Tax=Poseidonibacter antarcticus TaxID=2478538 RepID=UPI000EF4A214|nr:hypothetical protein [Poseidonibacter antarcticus]